MSTPSETSPQPRVLAVVVARKGDSITAVLESIEAQVYEVEGIVVLAWHRPELPANFAHPPKRATSMSQVLSAAGSGVDFLWLLDSRTTARRDALQALVSTALQVDASVVGSKVLDIERPEELLSVGAATDVFGFPYTGLEAGELDQEQFDVIRDVAYVEPASMLVRRDLAGGIGGLDRKLPYIANGLDLCQRARVVGGRIVVAPASEVFNKGLGPDRPQTWREQAGRIRVMIKTYTLLTLLWALPGLAMIGLLHGLYQTVRGSWRALPDLLGAWLWNVRHLLSTLAARRRAPAISVDSDRELFRFQVRGSVQLRTMASDMSAIWGSSAADEEAVGVVEDDEPTFWRRPEVMAAVLGMAFLLLLTRSIIQSGVPATGFALPLAESAWNTLRAYAGGWNLAGLGSSEPMHPSVGATAAVQLVFGSRAALAATLMTVGSSASALVGTYVLIRRAGLGLGAGTVAAAVYVAGFPMLVMAADGYWPGLLALGGIPWAVAGIVGPAPASRAGRVGRLARIVLATAWSAMFVPPLVVVPFVFGMVWAVAARKPMSLLTGLAGSILSLPVLFPWLAGLDPFSLLSSGVPFHADPVWWASVPMAVAGLAMGLSGRGRPLTVGLVGLLIGSGGFLAARAASLGAGREVTAAGLLVMSLGMALVVAGALEGPLTLESAGFFRGVLAYLAVGAAVLVGLSTLLALPSGRMGLPDDRFEKLAFARSRAAPHGADRILLAGPAETLPGEFRRLPDGTAYRLVGGELDYPQAWLPEPLAGDLALERTLTDLLSDGDQRPGRRLAEYGVRWLVATGPAPLVQTVAVQLDLIPLGGLFIAEGGGVWENTTPAYLAETGAGVPWSWRPPDYEGPAGGGTVLIRENADPGWTPDPWESAGWANRLPAGEGVATFGGVDSYRLMAQGAGVWVMILLVLGIGLRSGSRQGAAA